MRIYAEDAEGKDKSTTDAQQPQAITLTYAWGISAVLGQIRQQ